MEKSIYWILSFSVSTLIDQSANHSKHCCKDTVNNIDAYVLILTLQLQVYDINIEQFDATVLQ